MFKFIVLVIVAIFVVFSTAENIGKNFLIHIDNNQDFIASWCSI